MAAEKKQITRTRISLSCQTCRRRKVKCSKTHPVCESCQKAGEECIWGDQTGDAPYQADGQTVSNHHEPRKRKAAEFVEDDQVRARPEVSSLAVRAIEQKLTQLTALMHDLNRLTPKSISSSPNADSDPATYDSDSTNAQNKLTTGSYDDQPWVRVLDKLDRMNDFMRSSIRVKPTVPTCTSSGYEARGTWSKDLNHINQRFLMAWDTEMPVLETHLDKDQLAPTEEEANILFRLWLWSSFPVLPVVSPHVVFQKYNAFFEWYRKDMDRGLPNPDPSFMPFLVSMWYVAHLSMSAKAREKWFPWVKDYQAQRLWKRLLQYIEAMKTEGDHSIWCLAASLTGQYAALEGQDVMTNNLRNTMNVRIAQSLGLHNQKSLKDLPLIEAEMRKRLWWEIVTQDISLAAVSGMPPMLDACYTDINEVSELKDKSLGTDEALAYMQHLKQPESRSDCPDDPTSTQTSSFTSVHYLVAKARYKITQATKLVVQANMRTRPMTMDELKQLRQSMLKSSHEVNKIITCIPTRGVPEMDFVPATNNRITSHDHTDIMATPVTSAEIDSFLREAPQHYASSALSALHRSTNSAFHRWARIMLSMLLDRLDCISYAPFLKNSRSRLWAVARNCALKSCHGFMRKYLTLAEDPELERFKWMWQANFQPMHAVIIMLVDLHDRPHSDEGPRSRAMIDRMFYLTGHMDGTNNLGLNYAMPLREGGQEAWQMLIKLRHKSWLKAGLDPDVLWSEEDQTAVGVGKPLSQNDLFVRSLREDIIISHKERQKRSKAANYDARSATTFDLSSARQTNQKQRLHPSELGPGEIISGPVTRGLADMNLHDVQPALLLRARCDQPVMPSPLLMTSTQHNDEKKLPEPEPGQSQQKSGANVQSLHIGELIQKIRESRPRDNIAETPQPAMTGQSAVEAEDWPLQQISPQNPVCTFRNANNTMEAAYHDLLEQKASLHEQSSANANDAAASQPTGMNTGTSTWPTSSFTSNYLKGPDRTLEMYQQSIEQRREQPELLSMAASLPPTLHSRSINSLETPALQGWWQRISASANHEDEPVQQPPSSTSGPPTSSFVEFQQSLEPSSEVQALPCNDEQMDFDWERWDELFGSAGGFEDMMLELTTETVALEAHGHV